MRWTFDFSARALYVYLNEDLPVDRQIEVSGMIVDVAADGTPVGIECLDFQPTDETAAALKTLGVSEDGMEALGLLWMLGYTVPLVPTGPAVPEFPTNSAGVPERELVLN